jgi:outer membrane protein assembly factor BamD (BamD/ComL family)
MSQKIPTRIVAGALLFMGAMAATAFACGWMGTLHTVRFNEFLTEREMGRLPPLPTMANGMNEVRIAWELECSDEDHPLEEHPSEEVDALWDRAEQAETAGKLTEARSLLKNYLEWTTIDRAVSYPTDRQLRRNSAIDRLDALTALDHGSNDSRVQAYLDARRIHDGNPFDKIENYLSRVGSDGNLRDNVAYLRAARLYQDEKFEEAKRAFTAIALQDPQSEKREASLFMAAVATMKTSTAYAPTSGDEAHLHEYGPARSSHTVAIDKPWHDALAGFKRVMTQYPRGRYFDDARGWVAYLKLRNADRAGALVEYYRLLADKQNENTRIEAAFSLTLVRHHASDEELSRIERELAGEPEAALAYAYHNIYNYSINLNTYPPYEEVRDYRGNYDSEATRLRNDELAKEWQKDLHSVERKELSRILAFSLRLIERYPKLAIGGGFALRAAQASVELGHNEDAAIFSQRTLQSRLNDDERVQALWVFGVAEHRLKHFSSARKSLETLLRDYPKTHLTEGARRNLAMIAEDEGDIDGALEQYIALDYNLDVAYFVDVLMTTEQLAGFIQRHAESPKANELTYALGLRYLRSNLWNEARATFAKVRTTAPSETIYSGVDCLNDYSKCVDPKDGDFNYEDEPIITPRLVMHDVQTANDLETMEQAVIQANGNEAKAEALYQLASYQYEASSLLFYNPVAWTNSRYWSLSRLADQSSYRANNESQILFAYMQEHDTLARALKIYLEVVDRFPHTRAARDSFYTAAVCHERLSDYNPYWREIYGAGLHAGSRLVTYSHVKAAYPLYQLPRGTYGWQPSTRTVNGGPGFATPPKPLPTPTRTARVKLLLESYFNPVFVFWQETGRRGLSLITILVAMGITAHIATKNRKLLRPKLLRVRTRNAHAAPADQPCTEMFWIAPQDERMEEIRRFLSKRLAEFWELAQDANTRPLLFRSILSHSFLAGLIVSLLWTLHFG